MSMIPDNVHKVPSFSKEVSFSCANPKLDTKINAKIIAIT